MQPKNSVFFVRNITIERSCGTGEAERVRWVYEWGGGSESGANDATVSFIARTANYQTPTMQGGQPSAAVRQYGSHRVSPTNLWGVNRLSPNRSGGVWSMSPWGGLTLQSTFVRCIGSCSGR